LGDYPDDYPDLARFTNHAKSQLLKRRISEGEVMQVLSTLTDTILTRANRFASYAEIHGRYMVVIYEKIANEDIAMTAMTAAEGD